MTEMVFDVWRCPCCGSEIFTLDDLEYGDIICDACEVPIEYVGHQDIAVSD